MGCQADVTATPLASFALIMAAEAVETSASTHIPPEISTNLYFLNINCVAFDHKMDEKIHNCGSGRTTVETCNVDVGLLSSSRKHDE